LIAKRESNHDWKIIGAWVFDKQLIMTGYINIACLTIGKSGQDGKGDYMAGSKAFTV
jgi:hypothetical protein